MLSEVVRLEIRIDSSSPYWRDDIGGGLSDGTEWLELFRPFKAVEKLDICEELAECITHALEGRTEADGKQNINNILDKSVTPAVFIAFLLNEETRANLEEEKTAWSSSGSVGVADGPVQVNGAPTRRCWLLGVVYATWGGAANLAYTRWNFYPLELEATKSSKYRNWGKSIAADSESGPSRVSCLCPHTWTFHNVCAPFHLPLWGVSFTRSLDRVLQWDATLPIVLNFGRDLALVNTEMKMDMEKVLSTQKGGTGLRRTVTSTSEFRRPENICLVAAPVSDRYLAFFQERPVNVIRDLCVTLIVQFSGEELSIDSLRKLHRKATIVDTSFDPRAEPTTTRAAWDKVRDNLEGVVAEADAQQAFVDILDNDVIKPLTNLKASQELLVLAEIPVLIIGYPKGNRRSDKEAGRGRSRGIRREICRPYREHNFEAPAGILEEISSSGVPNKRIGGKSSALFRDRQEDTPASTPVRELEPSKSEEGISRITPGFHLVFDDECRRAVGFLNTLRLKRVENLDDAYDCLAALVFTPTVKNVLVKYMDAQKALAGTDASGLRASFGHALSISIPPLTLYCNYRPDVYSDLIFGVPLVNLSANQDCVPKVIRMCIEEVEKRGLNTHKIYLVGSIYDAEILQLRRRFESEEAFSFSSTDNIHSVAMLLKLYLWDLPKPLFMLSLKDCRKYRQNRARYAENDHSMLRSKIHELHPVHKASLEAVLRHLLLVSSHSDKNAMTVEALAAQFCYTVLRGNAVLEGSIHAKKLVMEDLIQNAYTLFGERPPQSSFSSSQSDSAVEGRLTPLLGLSLS
ncbi:hypothetical protein EDB83DRAFT_2559309, partial [Lactarius deliciosus]